MYLGISLATPTPGYHLPDGTWVPPENVEDKPIPGYTPEVVRAQRNELAELIRAKREADARAARAGAASPSGPALSPLVLYAIAGGAAYLLLRR